ncbi:hypothetical protein ATSB10_14820 [Dyella thiooxydans]|uniref:Uncharacterized protein n=1 Tax=Dyella thiooxydans TaxID=445710 RepID=A0A160MZW7_9GAMM|nr:hypothetical protein ATSB10_14820 [Dyella thiooxydans]
MGGSHRRCRRRESARGRGGCQQREEHGAGTGAHAAQIFGRLAEGTAVAGRGRGRNEGVRCTPRLLVAGKVH